MKKTIPARQPKHQGQKANVCDYEGLEDDGFLYQLIEGVLEVAPSPIPLHQQIVSRLAYVILDFLESHPLGKLYIAPLDVELNDKNVYQPDLLFVSNERLNIIGKKRVLGAPDLVIEILSDSTRQLDLVDKYKVYEENGVQEYWIADPDSKSFSFYQWKNSKFKAVTVQDSYFSDVLKGFAINTKEFWGKLI